MITLSAAKILQYSVLHYNPTHGHVCNCKGPRVPTVFWCRRVRVGFGWILYVMLCVLHIYATLTNRIAYMLSIAKKVALPTI